MKDLASIAEALGTGGSFRHGTAWLEHLREVDQTTAGLESYRVTEPCLS